MPTLAPVIERTGVEPTPPWPVLGEGDPYLIPLCGEMTDAEIGSVVWQLAQYNQIEVQGRAAAAILHDIVRAESLVLPGGISIRSDNKREIAPGCCAGLEDWRSWLQFESTGQPPWMGHEPDAWMERVGEVARVWSHGELAQGDYGEPFFVDIPFPEFRRELATVERDLLAFVGALRRWGERHAPRMASALADRFGEAFEITTGEHRDLVT